MKVLMISHDPSVFVPGSPAHLRMEAYRAHLDDLRIIVVSGRRGIIRDPKGFSGFIPDLVTSQDPFEHGVLAWWYARRYGARLELQVHTDFLSPYFSQSVLGSVRVFLARILLGRADCIRVVSERIKKSLIERSPKLSKRITVLPLLAKPAPAHEEIILHVLYPQFSFIYLVASRITKEKNIGMVLSAFAEVLKKHPKAGLVVVGTGPEEEALKRRAEKLGLEKSVVFIDWTNSLGSYYKSADGFLLSSWYEGYGLTLLEAAHARVPIVTTDVGLVGEILTDAHAFVVPPGDAARFAHAMNELLENKALREAKRARLGALTGIFLDEKEYVEKVVSGWRGCTKR
ncbi:MAG: glycosyltransferase [Patescibacteria group bacterium]